MSPENIASFCGCLTQTQQSGVTFTNRDLLMLHISTMDMLETPNVPLDCSTMMQQIDVIAPVSTETPNNDTAIETTPELSIGSPDSTTHDHTTAAESAASSGECSMGSMNDMGEMGDMMSTHHSMMSSMMQEIMMMRQEMMMMRQEMLMMRQEMMNMQMMGGMGMSGSSGGMSGMGH